MPRLWSVYTPCQYASYNLVGRARGARPVGQLIPPAGIGVIPIAFRRDARARGRTVLVSDSPRGHWHLPMLWYVSYGPVLGFTYRRRTCGSYIFRRGALAQVSMPFCTFVRPRLEGCIVRRRTNFRSFFPAEGLMILNALWVQCPAPRDIWSAVYPGGIPNPTLYIAVDTAPSSQDSTWLSPCFPSCQMLQVLGDSFAFHLGQFFTPESGVRVMGRRGARVGDPAFRRWAIRLAAHDRPDQVLLIVGGNDLSHDPAAFRQRHLLADFKELATGLLAAGVREVVILPLPPRDSARPAAATVAQYSRRRRLANYILRRTFTAPPVRCIAFQVPPGFLGRDGVHPSAAGWQALRAVATGLLSEHCSL